jgi:hypothetical protein
MSKAILVIDMPESCDKCPLFHSFYSDMTCGANNWGIDFPYPKDFRQNWCPLAVPEKINVPAWDDNIKTKNQNANEFGLYMYNRGYYRGYNLCIDEILGN